MATCEPGSQESLRRHLNWLYGPGGVYPGNVPCRCQRDGHGQGWVRTTTHPDCPHHGTKASKARDERLRVKTGRRRAAQTGGKATP